MTNNDNDRARDGIDPEADQSFTHSSTLRDEGDNVVTPTNEAIGASGAVEDEEISQEAIKDDGLSSSERVSPPLDAAHEMSPVTEEAVDTRSSAKERGAPRRRPGLLSNVLTAVVIVVLLVVGYFAVSYYRDANGQAHGKEVTVFVNSGASLDSLAKVLADRDIIGSSLYFRIYLKLHHPPNLQPGIYYLFQDEPYGKIFAAIGNGPSAVRLTTLPGETLRQIAATVGQLHGHSASGFLHAATPSSFSSPFLTSSTPSLEGLLYPDTYFIDPTESDHQIIQTMLNRTSQIADELSLQPGQTYHGLSAYQVIVGASIIEREASTAVDMPKVARVILNRLAAGMNLQMDSTVRYATGNFTGTITGAQLAYPSPYNTYVSPGLPPTPISAPSIAALRAMLNPAQGSWLYFVALKGQTNEGFFDTYAEQQAAIAQAGGLG
ncbi:MAG: endolytic transglycosylase MltG [Acidimicrobiales bacterium]